MTWNPSPAQVKLIEDMYRERFTAETRNAGVVWSTVRDNARKSHKGFEAAIALLKNYPKLNATPKPQYVAPVAPTPPVLPELATEEGLYRDPATGTLYRINHPKPKNAWDHPSPVVSEYSKKATKRRLTTEGETVVKGTWTRYKANQSRAAITYSRWEKSGQSPVSGVKILAAWAMSDQDKVDYQYGICLFCMRGLEDAESVKRNYGPVCARNLGLPWDSSRKGLRVVTV